GTVVRVERAAGTVVAAADVIVTVESMKMEYAIEAGAGGTVAEVHVAAGDAVKAGEVLAVVAAAADGGAGSAPVDPAEVGAVGEPGGPGSAESDGGSAGRADLAEVVERHAVGLDAARPEAVARRHQRGLRTARENVDDLVD